MNVRTSIRLSVAALLMAACTTEHTDGLAPNSPAPLSYISISTRAAEGATTPFEMQQGSQVDLTIGTQSAHYTYTNGVWTTSDNLLFAAGTFGAYATGAMKVLYTGGVLETIPVAYVGSVGVTLTDGVGRIAQPLEMKIATARIRITIQGAYGELPEELPQFSITANLHPENGFGPAPADPFTTLHTVVAADGGNIIWITDANSGYSPATIAPQTITAGSTFLTIAAANKDMAPQYGTQRYTVKVPAGGIAFQAGKEYHYTISLGGGGQGRIVEQEINEFVAEDDVAHLNTGTPGIRTEKDLRQFAEDWNKNPNNAIIKWEDAKGSRTIRLLADIVMSDELFTPIKGFICTFDGQGHTISGLKISQTGTGTGMFQEISNIAVVRNLHLTDVNVKGGKYVGGIAGGNSGTVAGCSVQGTINANTGDGYACGIVGNNDGTIAGCYSQITTMTGKTKYGIAYRSGGLIKGCCWYSNSNTVSSAANSSTGTCLGYYQIPQLHTDKGYVDIMNTKGLDTLGAKENGYRWVHVSGANPVLVKK